MGFRSRLKDIAADRVRPGSLLGAGSEAPAFALETLDGGRVRSGDLAGSDHIVLVFCSPDALGAPGLKAFAAQRERFAVQRCRLFAVVGGAAKGLRDPGLPVLLDPGRWTATAFRTARRGVPATFTSVFLVDDRGIVRLALKGWPSPESVLAAAERCNQTGFRGTGRRGRRRVPEVSAVGLRRLRQEEPETVVLDVRVVADWRTGHVPGALNVPLEELEERLEELPDRSLPIVVVCDQGLRAPGAAWILKTRGWQRPYTLVDGMAAWKGSLEVG